MTKYLFCCVIGGALVFVGPVAIGVEYGWNLSPDMAKVCAYFGLFVLVLAAYWAMRPAKE